MAHLKLLIAKLKRGRCGASSERGRTLIAQIELELGEVVAAASEDAAKAETAAGKDNSANGGTTPRRNRPALPCRSTCRASGW